jgi:hypothetical protein
MLNLDMSNYKLPVQYYNYTLIDKVNSHEVIALVGVKVLSHMLNTLYQEKVEAEMAMSATLNAFKRLDSELVQLLAKSKYEQIELEKYREYYGTFIDPYQILHNLFNGGTIADGNFLISPRMFKDREVNTKNKRNRQGVNKWLSHFKYWGIIQSFGKKYKANCTYQTAEIVLRRMLQEGI